MICSFRKTFCALASCGFISTVTLGMSYRACSRGTVVLCALLRVQASHMTDSLRAAGFSLCGIYNKHKYTLKRICCALLLKCYRSRDAELRPGLATAEELGEGLMWSVNTKKVQSKQYLTAKYILECVFRI